LFIATKLIDVGDELLFNYNEPAVQSDVLTELPCASEQPGRKQNRMMLRQSQWQSAVQQKTAAYKFYN